VYLKSLNGFLWSVFLQSDKKHKKNKNFRTARLKGMDVKTKGPYVNELAAN